MSDAGGEATDDAACTAVLLSVPQQVAERIESFLTVNGIACRIRLNTEMTPERLAEEYLGQSPEATGVLDLRLLGPLLRGRLAEDQKAEIKVVGSEIPPVWDVLVRPEDLPTTSDRVGPERRTPELNVPVASPTASRDGPGSVGGVPPDATASGGPMILCELPGNEAGTLTDRLNDAGIPAAVMAAEEPDRDRPMQARVVPVGVRSEEVERARAYLAPGDAGR
jgi:hypothetical protein